MFFFPAVSQFNCQKSNYVRIWLVGEYFYFKIILMVLWFILN